jgi:hypothetical protein
MGLLWSARDNLSNLDCVALRAMTDTEDESVVMLIGIFTQLFKLCGAILCGFEFATHSQILLYPLK